MKSLFKKILFGDTEIKEYSTVTVSGRINESVFLKTGKITIDISAIHWLICLEPIVFAIWLKKGEHLVALDEKTNYTMYFTDSYDAGLTISKKKQ